MSFELFKSIVDETKGHDVGLSLHYGGESLLHPMFETFVSYAMRQHEQFNNIGFFTNGMLFSQDIADFVIRQGVDWVTFSLEGYAVVNDKIRLGSKYDVATKNLEYLLDKRTGKKPFVTINATLHPDHNEDLWLDFVSEWVKKVDRVAISPCMDENLRWTSFHPNVKIISEPYCTSPFVAFGILYNGDVVPCCHDLNGVLTVGNVKDEGVYEVWKSQKMQNLRYDLITHHHAGLCVPCNCWRTKVDEKPIIHNNIKIYYDAGVTRIYEKSNQ
jgi:radical SAM protein with 4Fe4S-binding SPASM domain